VNNDVPDWYQQGKENPVSTEKEEDDLLEEIKQELQAVIS
jgi:hypothetical protein